MGVRGISVQNEPVISDRRVREELRDEIDRAINIDRSITRDRLAARSGVSVHQIDQILSRSPEKQRRVTLSDALSIAWVLGERAINAIVAPAGYAAKPLDEGREMPPTQIAAKALANLSVIVTAAADGRIDHTEEPACREAADELIATVLPLSSHGEAA